MILVIGATGMVGRAVVSQLVERQAVVRAMVRDPDAARMPLEVEVVHGDLTAPGTLDRCLDGIDTVFLVWTAAAAAADAALGKITKRSQRIVYLSAPIKTPHPLFQQPNPAAALNARIERLIEQSGISWTFLRPGMFAANAIRWWAPQIRAGDVVRWPYLDVPTAPIDERDIAAVAVRALCEDGHEGAEYVLTGPESLSQAEQISIIGRVIGRKLRTEELSRAEAERRVISMLLNAWAAAAGQPAYVTPTVANVTGKPPRSFFEWARDHAQLFR